MLTLCVFPIITPQPSLQSYTMHAERGGVICGMRPKKSVSNGSFKVLRGVREMYMYRARTTVGSSQSCCQENQCHANNLPVFL